MKQLFISLAPHRRFPPWIPSPSCIPSSTGPCLKSLKMAGAPFCLTKSLSSSAQWWVHLQDLYRRWDVLVRVVCGVFHPVLSGPEILGGGEKKLFRAWVKSEWCSNTRSVNIRHFCLGAKYLYLAFVFHLLQMEFWGLFKSSLGGHESRKCFCPLQMTLLIVKMNLRPSA